MPVYKLDLIFRAGGNGWRETYYRNFSGDLSTAGVIANTLADKRIALCGYPVSIDAYSVTDPLTEGRQGQSVYFTPPKLGTGASSDIGAAAPSACINIQYLHAAGNKTKRTQMRGVWDAAITDFNDLRSPEFAQWQSLYGQWRSYVLQQQFGWMTRDVADTSVAIYNFAEGADLPTFTFKTDFFPEIQVGTFQQVRFSKFNNSKSVLNRELIVRVLTRNTAVVAQPISAAAMTGVGKALRYEVPTFIIAENIGIERVGRRAPGRPLLRTPGRASARART